MGGWNRNLFGDEYTMPRVHLLTVGAATVIARVEVPSIEKSLHHAVRLFSRLCSSLK